VRSDDLFHAAVSLAVRVGGIEGRDAFDADPVEPDVHARALQRVSPTSFARSSNYQLQLAYEMQAYPWLGDCGVIPLVADQVGLAVPGHRLAIRNVMYLR